MRELCSRHVHWLEFKSQDIATMTDFQLLVIVECVLWRLRSLLRYKSIQCFFLILSWFYKKKVDDKW